MPLQSVLYRELPSAKNRLCWGQLPHTPLTLHLGSHAKKDERSIHPTSPTTRLRKWIPSNSPELLRLALDTLMT